MVVRWHSGRCLSYGEGVAYFALAEAIRGRLQLLSQEGDEASGGDEDLRTLVDHGLETDWNDPAAAEGPILLRHAVQVKNIWIPYGE